MKLKTKWSFKNFQPFDHGVAQYLRSFILKIKVLGKKKEKKNILKIAS